MQLELKHLQTGLGITFVYVTHDQEEALTMSDRIVLMRQGRIAQIGSPRDLYDRPASRYVADFVGETNVLAGVVAESGGGDAALRVGEACCAGLPSARWRSESGLARGPTRGDHDGPRTAAATRAATASAATVDGSGLCRLRGPGPRGAGRRTALVANLPPGSAVPVARERDAHLARGPGALCSGLGCGPLPLPRRCRWDSSPPCSSFRT